MTACHNRRCMKGGTVTRTRLQWTRLSSPDSKIACNHHPGSNGLDRAPEESDPNLTQNRATSMLCNVQCSATFYDAHCFNNTLTSFATAFSLSEAPALPAAASACCSKPRSRAISMDAAWSCATVAAASSARKQVSCSSGGAVARTCQASRIQYAGTLIAHPIRITCAISAR
jgi:hypothetical protein